MMDDVFNTLAELTLGKSNGIQPIISTRYGIVPIPDLGGGQPDEISELGTSNPIPNPLIPPGNLNSGLNLFSLQQMKALEQASEPEIFPQLEQATSIIADLKHQPSDYEPRLSSLAFVLGKTRDEQLHPVDTTAMTANSVNTSANYGKQFEQDPFEPSDQESFANTHFRPHQTIHHEYADTDTNPDRLSKNATPSMPIDDDTQNIDETFSADTQLSSLKHYSNRLPSVPLDDPTILLNHPHADWNSAPNPISPAYDAEADYSLISRSSSAPNVNPALLSGENINGIESSPEFHLKSRLTSPIAATNEDPIHESVMERSSGNPITAFDKGDPTNQTSSSDFAPMAFQTEQVSNDEVYQGDAFNIIRHADSITPLLLGDYQTETTVSEQLYDGDESPFIKNKINEIIPNSINNLRDFSPTFSQESLSPTTVDPLQVVITEKFTTSVIPRPEMTNIQSDSHAKPNAHNASQLQLMRGTASRLERKLQNAATNNPLPKTLIQRAQDGSSENHNNRSTGKGSLSTLPIDKSVSVSIAPSRLEEAAPDKPPLNSHMSKSVQSESEEIVISQPNIHGNEHARTRHPVTNLASQLPRRIDTNTSMADTQSARRNLLRVRQLISENESLTIRANRSRHSTISSDDDAAPDTEERDTATKVVKPALGKSQKASETTDHLSLQIDRTHHVLLSSVRVNIERIEIHRPQRHTSATAKPKLPQPTLSLHDYLKNGRGNK